MKGSSSASSSGLPGLRRKKEEDLRRGEVGLLKRPIVVRMVGDGGCCWVCVLLVLRQSVSFCCYEAVDVCD